MDAGEWAQNIGVVVGVTGILVGIAALMTSRCRRASPTEAANEREDPDPDRPPSDVSSHPDTTVTEPTREQDPRIGFYVIGVFDILGQSRRLLERTDLPPATRADAERLDRKPERNSWRRTPVQASVPASIQSAPTGL